MKPAANPGVQPALSREEWEFGGIAGDSKENAAFPSPGREALYASDWFTGDRRHALAALALYGQPFGFHREDVKLLRETYDGCNESYPVELSPDEEGRFRSIIARIAALLPPEP